MLLFITSEVMFFAGPLRRLLQTRANSPGHRRRRQPAPADELPSDPVQSSRALDLILPATILLITSSFTCQFGVWAIRRNDRKGLIRAIAVTVVLGTTFL